ncbi:MAG: hypothetical protein KDM64_13335, partial [Verrucomicrobiae bacterium]|nr:hypothetical protein [Verrucomicrobiae bacterium]
RLLSRLGDDAFGYVSSGDDGFGMIRDGSRACYLGPVIAITASEGEGMIRTLLGMTSSDRWVFWDIPDENRSAVALAEALGFEPVRVLTRMWLGDNATPGDPSRVWGLADPGLG